MVTISSRMIPLRDTIKSRTIPFVNYGLIACCGLVFLYELSLGDEIESFLYTYGVTPARAFSALFRGDFSFDAVFPLFTSLFLHGGWLHLLGNMIYLYVFGDNVEDRLGHGAYLVFYLLAGVGASLTEVCFQRASTAPLIGASGAIAGVLGAYFILYPRSRILTLIPLLFFFPVLEISAFFFLGFWFVMQFIQASLSSGAHAGGGVAWWAHAGGFIFGAGSLPFFLRARRR